MSLDAERGIGKKTKHKLQEEISNSMSFFKLLLGILPRLGQFCPVLILNAFWCWAVLFGGVKQVIQPVI